MKISANDATVTAVTNLGENHGEEVVPATAVRIEGSLPPRYLGQLGRHLPKQFFDEQNVPITPELGPIKWKPEYEKALFTIAGRQFTKADVKNITFEVREGFMVNLGFTAKVVTDEDGRGFLTGLVKQEVSFALEKMTQKRVDDPPEEGDGKPASEAQPPLPGTETAPTADGKPIVPLVH